MDDRTDTPRRKKRKFPGPAGLLPDDRPDDLSCGEDFIPSSQLILTQSNFSSSIFDDGPWSVMSKDAEELFERSPSDFPISRIVEGAVNGELVNKRVAFLAGVVRNLDGSLQDPSIVLIDKTNEIKGTLHRDAWEVFGRHIVPQYSVMLLRNVSVLTAGNVIKRNYLNVTLNNIVAVYCDQGNARAPHEGKTSVSPLKDGTYSSETVPWNSETVYILRNNAFDVSKDEPSKLPEKENETPRIHLFRDVIASEIDDDFSIEETLSGIRPDDFSDDFS